VNEGAKVKRRRSEKQGEATKRERKKTASLDIDCERYNKGDLPKRFKGPEGQDLIHEHGNERFLPKDLPGPVYRMGKVTTLELLREHIECDGGLIRASHCSTCGKAIREWKKRALELLRFVEESEKTLREAAGELSDADIEERKGSGKGGLARAAPQEKRAQDFALEWWKRDPKLSVRNVAKKLANGEKASGERVTCGLYGGLETLRKKLKKPSAG
jgi:hypothetical protein